jgi:type IV pilus assembly protein PilW
MKRTSAPCGRSCVGFSLVELMVAMLVGLLVIGGALAAYAKARDIYDANAAAARLQENARYALAVIEQDLRMANYWGLTNRADLVTINPASSFPATCGDTWVTDVTHYVAGYNNGYGASCAASGGGAAIGSDVLIVRRASAQRITPQSATIATANRNQVLVVTSRTGGQVFVPSHVSNTLPAGFATSDPAGQPPLADTRQMLVNAYYVSRNSSVANGYPALRRKTLVAGPAIGEEEVLPGIEDLQFQVGVDSDGDTSADLYANPGAVPAGSTPVSVRIWLRLRAEEIDPAFSDATTYAYADRRFTAPRDHHRRLLVATTIQLRNAPP